MRRSLLLACLLSIWLSGILPLGAAGASSPLGDASHALGLKILRDPVNQASNLCFSPFGIVQGLAMASLGAGAETRTEILQALNLPAEETQLVDAVREVSGALRRLDGTNEVMLTAANRLFLKAGIRTRPEFVRAVATAFGEMPGFLDLDHDPEAARTMINGWASEVSHAAIGELIPRGGVRRDDSMLLINAIHLKASWKNEFRMGATKPAAFLLTPSLQVEVPTMGQVDFFAVSQGSGYTTIVLPCEERALQAVIWLPDEGFSVADLVTRLSAVGLQQPEGLKWRKVALSLPRFKVESPDLDLKSALTSCGIRSAWDPVRSDFSRMAILGHPGSFYLGGVVQRTKMEINETGIEGVSFLEMKVRFRSVLRREEPVEIHVNRPFLMAVQHVPTGTCLFLARVMDPR